MTFTMMKLRRYQGAVYGKCVAENYQNVGKGMCAQEFMRLKDCYLVCPCPAIGTIISKLIQPLQRAAKRKSL